MAKNVFALEWDKMNFVHQMAKIIFAPWWDNTFVSFWVKITSYAINDQRCDKAATNHKSQKGDRSHSLNRELAAQAQLAIKNKDQFESINIVTSWDFIRVCRYY